MGVGRRLRSHWKLVAAFTVVFLIGLGLGAGSGEETASEAGNSIATTVTVEAEPQTVTDTLTETVVETVEPSAGITIPGDGTFLVGDDIQPGTYRTAGGAGCYWARLKGTSGELGDIIANGNVTGPTTITIAPSDAAFQTSGCVEWQQR